MSKYVLGPRVGAEDEAKGLDLSQHAELAYAGTREYRMLDSLAGPHGAQSLPPVAAPEVTAATGANGATKS